MSKLFIPGSLLVMFLASNEILTLGILSGLVIWFLVKITSNRGY